MVKIRQRWVGVGIEGGVERDMLSSVRPCSKKTMHVATVLSPDPISASGVQL